MPDEAAGLQLSTRVLKQVKGRNNVGKPIM